MIQEGLNCLEMTDYFFTNIEPKPIIVERPAAQHSTSTSHQPLNRDKVSQQTHPQQPEETWMHLYMLINRQVSTSPESYRHKNYITCRSTGCIQFSLCLFPWWKRRYPRSTHRVTNYQIVIHRMKRQIHDSIHLKKKDNMGQ